ncbi:hypothetical protein P4605_10030 [Priestia aryabhattai]|uniref:hypothetical protein n=1 Tax=Priestia aryabhattai TaxID=412384 RepID=UPI002E1ED39F|nr:hypothetical protein [Priestia aryabhattai]
MLREFLDLASFIVTEPIKLFVDIVDDVKDSASKNKFVSQLYNDKSDVEPTFGSIIYTEIGMGISGHSGIYIGEDEVIALNGKGNVIQTTLYEFTDHPTTIHRDIYVPYDNDGYPFGHPTAAFRAMEMLGSRRRYNLIIDNCHQFCSGCITGNFENANNFLWMLKQTFEKEHVESVNWEKWRWKNKYS